MKTILKFVVGALAILLVAQKTSAQRSSQTSKSGSQAAGASIAGLSFTDLEKRIYNDLDLRARKAGVFVFLSTECPVCNKYTDRLNQLHKDYASKGVLLVGVNSNVQETRAQVLEHAKQAGYVFPIVKDAGNVLADKFGAETTPQAFVLDATGVIRYRGRLDDNETDVKVKSNDLREALGSVLAGKPVRNADTKAFGCTLRRDVPRVENGKVTYAKHVAALLNKNCVSCHRPGEVAPFSLLTYDQAAAWASEIKTYTQSRQMPPWKPAPGFGEFKDERRLNDQEIATLGAWADSGAPRGDMRECPAPPQFVEGWTLGEPDLVLAPEREYKLPTAGRDLYRHFVLPTHFSEDKYVIAFDVRPGNRTVVHHTLNFVDTSGTARKRDGEDGQPGYSHFGGPGFTPRAGLGGWAPGNIPKPLPDGIARVLPAGGDVVIQVHYHLSGKPETDRTQIGLYFAKTPPKKIVRNIMVLPFPPLLRLPAGADNHEMRASQTLSQDVMAISVTPHMHLLGKDMKVTATLPDGNVKPLIYIPQWDFNWQDTYYFKEHLALPKGTKIDVVAHYDNSDKNLRNPNKPPKLVHWGEQTTDEMCIAFVNFVRASEALPAR